MKLVPMKLVIDKIPDLLTLYIRQLRQILSAQGMVLHALPEMMEKATDTQLKQVLESHHKEVELHINRLKTILEQGAENAGERTAKSMQALIDESQDAVEDSTRPAIRDAALIVSALRIQHDEIASYGSVLQFARALGRDSDAEQLQTSLNEELHATQLLEAIAARVNPAARMAA